MWSCAVFWDGEQDKCFTSSMIFVFRFNDADLEAAFYNAESVRKRFPVSDLARLQSAVAMYSGKRFTPTAVGFMICSASSLCFSEPVTVCSFSKFSAFAV